jgi:superfamily II DNA or RNA helicase
VAALEELRAGVQCSGIVPGKVVRIKSSELSGDTLEVIYQDGNGSLGEAVLFRTDEAAIAVEAETGGWDYTADPATFRLVSEAYRIHLAHLFDPFVAVSSSTIIPLPHQIQAVYGCMLPKQPLRFLLADDPGAGKTIMAGLFIKELLLRGDLDRCLIVAPGSVVDNWQAELQDKFSLDFNILDNSMLNKGNPFDNENFLIARVHHVAWRDDMKELLAKADDWDLIIVDEAHKMSAAYQGREIKRTKLYRLGELAEEKAKHLVLMTATPHSGHHENFQLFMQLLDRDRFAGKFRQGAHKFDTSDVMRRMVKEELTRMDGTPLFPPREAQTAKYELSDMEMALYQAVTQYVREQMNLAKRQDKARRNVVGFALTMLQRRLASSPEAIYQSLRNRRLRLLQRIEDIEKEVRLQGAFDLSAKDIGFDSDAELEEYLYDEDALDTDDVEARADAALDLASAANSIPEMRIEIEALEGLEKMANAVRKAGVDRKWDEMRSLLDSDAMRDEDGTPRKIIIFTEHKATLDYLVSKVGGQLGKPEAVEVIHGGMNRQARLDVQESFWHDPDSRVLVATDAAGEGINLQCANIVVNYDMPWNPNKLEQRFGRVHRIGQERRCYMWNIVAEGTVEGKVWTRLFEKIDREQEALGGGKVFDVLGKAFEGHSLRELFLQSIENEDDVDFSKVSDAEMEAVIGNAKQLILEQAAAIETGLSDEEVEEIRVEMERAEARRLQPHFIAAFFVEAAQRLGIRIMERETGRYEVKHVPYELRKRGEGVPGQPSVLKAYKRITFEKDLVQTEENREHAALIAMGQPLLEAVIGEVLDRWRGVLDHGTVLVDPDPDATDPRILAYLESQVDDARADGRIASREFQFLERTLDGEWTFAGYAPYLDYEPLERVVPEANLVKANDLAKSLIAGKDWRETALKHAKAKLLPAHLDRVKKQRVPRIEKLEGLVDERLRSELRYHSNKILEYRSKGKEKYQLQILDHQRKHDEIEARRKLRLAELEREKHLNAKGVKVLSGVLVLPVRLLAEKNLLVAELDDLGAIEDTETSELAAMAAVMQFEEELGNRVIDRSRERGIGYDIEAWTPNGHMRAIEVKARQPTAHELCFTINEVRASFNKSDHFILAMVQVEDGDAKEIRYLRQPFEKDPGMNVTRVCERFETLWKRGVKPS